jgi:hypothetical protein
MTTETPAVVLSGTEVVYQCDSGLEFSAANVTEALNQGFYSGSGTTATINVGDCVNGAFDDSFVPTCISP